MAEDPDDPMRLWTGTWSPPKAKAARPAPKIEKTEEPPSMPEEDAKSG
ncbi:MAG: hypothetical protein ACT4PY_00100 [Armatimonadota bacterium]